MKVSREQAARNRERVVDTAAALFREQGLGGVGVAELMNAAGLTHGGFYAQFGSKEALMAEAVARAFEQSGQRWAQAAARHPDDPLAGVVKAYLSRLHRDRPGEGCVAAALGAEAGRYGSGPRAALTAGLRALVARLATLVRGRDAAARQRKAWATMAAMVGGIVLARAVDDAALSDEILKSVTDELLGQR
jgi:TetR/AcrR family transcriptional repressor of nem operon